MDNNFYKNILDNIDLPIIVFNDANEFIYANSAYKISYDTEDFETIANNSANKFIQRDYNQDNSNYKILIFNNNQVHQDFISTVSHELRTPLTSIRGFADTMLASADKLSEEQTKKFLQIIRNQADRLTRLVENLLEVSRMSKKEDMVFKEINFNKFISPVILLFEKKYPTKKYKIEASKNLPDIYADSDRLEQILTNLIDNASKYSQDNANVVIQADFSNNNVNIKIIDEAVKIPENQINKIFNKFSRIDNPLTRKTEGSGLGLYISKTLAEQMNGTIKVTNYEKGNIFTLSLPTASAENQLGLKFSGENHER